MKKLLAIIVAVVMLFALGVTAMAASKTPAASLSVKANVTDVLMNDPVSFAITMTSKSAAVMEDVAIVQQVAGAADKVLYSYAKVDPGKKIVENYVTAISTEGAYTFRVVAYANYGKPGQVELSYAGVVVNAVSKSNVGTLTITPSTTEGYVGDKVTYTVTFKNTSKVKLSNFAIVAADSTVLVAPRTLTAGSSVSAKYTSTFTAEGVFNFSATAYTNYNAGNSMVGSATSTINVKKFVYTAKATVSPESAAIALGESVKITYTLTNTSGRDIPDVAICSARGDMPVLQRYASIGKGKTVKYTITVTPDEINDTYLYAFHTYANYSTTTEATREEICEYIGTTIKVMPLTYSVKVDVNPSAKTITYGETASITFTVTNTSNRTIPKVSLVLPGANSEVVYNAGDLAKGKSFKYTYKFAPGADGYGTDEENDPVYAGLLVYSNYGTASQIFLGAKGADVTIKPAPKSNKQGTLTVVPDKTSVEPNGTINYTITFTNTSSVTLNNVALIIIHPREIEVVSTARTVAPGAKITKTYKVTAQDFGDNNQSNGYINQENLTIHAYSDYTDYFDTTKLLLASATGSVTQGQRAFAAKLEVTPDKFRAESGETVTFTYKLTNTTSEPISRPYFILDFEWDHSISFGQSDTPLAPGASITGTFEVPAVYVWHHGASGYGQAKGMASFDITACGDQGDKSQYALASVHVYTATTRSEYQDEDGRSEIPGYVTTGRYSGISKVFVNGVEATYFYGDAEDIPNNYGSHYYYTYNGTAYVYGFYAGEGATVKTVLSDGYVIENNYYAYPARVPGKIVIDRRLFGITGTITRISTNQGVHIHEYYNGGDADWITPDLITIETPLAQPVGQSAPINIIYVDANGTTQYFSRNFVVGAR